MALLGACTAFASPGDLDPSFSKHGKLQLRFSGGEETATDVVTLADGRLLVAGTTTDIGEDFFPEIAIARLRPDGRPDTSFGGDGRVSFGFSDTTVDETGLAVQADGKILVSGDAGFAIARLNPDGGPDAGFSGDGYEVTDLPGVGGESAAAVAVLGDGRILVAGNSKAGGVGQWTLARYTSAGALDPTFSVDGVETTPVAGNGSLAAIAVQADGRIVAAGSDGGHTSLARYLPDGGLDPSFSGDGIAPAPGAGATGLALDSAGRALISIGGDGQFEVARFTSTGGPDPGFSGDGVQTVPFAGGSAAWALTPLPGGGVAVAGDARHVAGPAKETDFAVAKLDDSGELDRSFAGDGTATTDFFCDLVDGARAITALPDGRLIAAGSCQYSFVRGEFTDGNFALTRYQSDGAVHDADADGISDKKDRCPQVAGPKDGKGCAKVRRSFISVRASKGKIVGGLASEAVDCEVGERIRLVLISSGRRTVVDKAKPAGTDFSFKPRRGGIYEVSTSTHLEPRAGYCNKATSSRVKP